MRKIWRIKSVEKERADASEKVSTIAINGGLAVAQIDDGAFDGRVGLKG
jgi:hypothetical protein